MIDLNPPFRLKDSTTDTVDDDPTSVEVGGSEAYLAATENLERDGLRYASFSKFLTLLFSRDNVTAAEANRLLSPFGEVEEYNGSIDAGNGTDPFSLGGVNIDSSFLTVENVKMLRRNPEFSEVIESFLDEKSQALEKARSAEGQTKAASTLLKIISTRLSDVTAAEVERLLTATSIQEFAGILDAGNSTEPFTLGGKNLLRDELSPELVLRVKENLRLTNTLVQLAEESAEIRDAAIENKRVITAISSFLNILTTRITRVTADEVRRLITANQIEEFAGILDAGNDTEPFNLGGEAIYKSELSIDVVIALQSDENLVQALLDLTESASLESPLPKALVQLLRTRDKETLVALEREATLSGNETLLRRLSATRKIFGIIDRNSFSDEILSSLEDEEFNVTKARVDAYSGSSPEDFATRARLTKLLAGYRRKEVLEALVPLLEGDGGRTVETVLQILDPVARTGDPKDTALIDCFLNIVATEQLSAAVSEFFSKIDNNTTAEDLRRFLNDFPINASVGENDFVEARESALISGVRVVNEIGLVSSLGDSVAIRESFGKVSPEESLRAIDGLGGLNERSRSALIAQLKEYLIFSDSDAYRRLFESDSAIALNNLRARNFEQSDLGSNPDGFRYLTRQYRRNISPLVNSLKASPAVGNEMAAHLQTVTAVDDVRGKIVQVKNPRRNRQISVSRLTQERKDRGSDLTEIERTYLRSVEHMSLYNPQLVAALSVRPAVTREFVGHQLKSLSEKTLERIRERGYFPAIQIGLGPNGLASLGEMTRNNPALAQETLVVDEGALPGGPFAVPNGPAWRLNSANKRRASISYSMPGHPGAREGSTVRSFGSPLRFNPGERVDNDDVRTGSINATVDFLPVPDDISNARYSTNDNLAQLLQVQSAMLCNNLSLNTRLVSREEAPDDGRPGKYEVELAISNMSTGEEETFVVRTDQLFVASGLGRPSYGFDTGGKEAEAVIDFSQTQDEREFPKLSMALDAFKRLGSRSKEKSPIGETLVLYGGGNSADTLLERLASLFGEDNPRVTDLKKIYVVADRSLSRRPRYAALRDLEPRGGRGNLVEFVESRVGDVTFTGGRNEYGQNLAVLDPDGRLIFNAEGKPIIADAAIAATGFKSDLSPIFTSKQKSRLARGEQIMNRVTLPTNPDVVVAEELDDNDVLLLGTASRPFLEPDTVEGKAKLAQYKGGAADALLRVSAGNAVAIGFRAPDTQAAMNIWLSKREVAVRAVQPEINLSIDIHSEKREPVNFSVSFDDSVDSMVIPADLSSKDQLEELLTAILSAEINNRLKYTGLENEHNESERTFVFEIEQQSDQTFDVSSRNAVPDSLATVLSDVFRSPDVQLYLNGRLNRQRGDRRVNLNISLKQNGKVDFGKTFLG